MSSEGQITLIPYDDHIIGYKNINVTELKPILYPLSSLYKNRNHNGKKIMPILEFSMCALSEDIKGFHVSFMREKQIIFENSDMLRKWEVVTEIEDWQGRLISITYYHRIHKNARWVEGERKKCEIQFVDFLNEMKIDYRGLIYAGLAIDVNTLKINPYN
jgi:hypothetical protein